jgi:hypothetical protein
MQYVLFEKDDKIKNFHNFNFSPQDELFFAIQSRNLERITFLLDSGIDVNSEIYWGNTLNPQHVETGSYFTYALHCVSTPFDKEYLIKLDAENYVGCIFKQGNELEILQIMLNHGADLYSYYFYLDDARKENCIEHVVDSCFLRGVIQGLNKTTELYENLFKLFVANSAKNEVEDEKTLNCIETKMQELKKNPDDELCMQTLAMMQRLLEYFRSCRY